MESLEPHRGPLQILRGGASPLMAPLPGKALAPLGLTPFGRWPRCVVPFNGRWVSRPIASGSRGGGVGRLPFGDLAPARAEGRPRGAPRPVVSPLGAAKLQRNRRHWKPQEKKAPGTAEGRPAVGLFSWGGGSRRWVRGPDRAKCCPPRPTRPPRRDQSPGRPSRPAALPPAYRLSVASVARAAPAPLLPPAGGAVRSGRASHGPRSAPNPTQGSSARPPNRPRPPRVGRGFSPCGPRPLSRGKPLLAYTAKYPGAALDVAGLRGGPQLK